MHKLFGYLISNFYFISKKILSDKIIKCIILQKTKILLIQTCDDLMEIFWLIKELQNLLYN